MIDEHDKEKLDERVAAAYRDLAVEQTPARLDRAVLREAAGVAKTRYGILRGRVRPLAWAAMIGLSLVVVLEFTRLPDGDPTPVEDRGTDALRSEALGNAAPAEHKTEEERAADPLPAAVPEAEPPTRQDGGRVRKLAPAPLSAPATKEARREAAAFAPTPTDADTQAACAEAEATGPDAWYACIQELDERGDHELAANERARFREVYPDFSPDNTHR